MNTKILSIKNSGYRRSSNPVILGAGLVGMGLIAGLKTSAFKSIAPELLQGPLYRQFTNACLGSSAFVTSTLLELNQERIPVLSREGRKRLLFNTATGVVSSVIFGDFIHHYNSLLKDTVIKSTYEFMQAHIHEAIKPATNTTTIKKLFFGFSFMAVSSFFYYPLVLSPLNSLKQKILDRNLNLSNLYKKNLESILKFIWKPYPACNIKNPSLAKRAESLAFWGFAHNITIFSFVPPEWQFFTCTISYLAMVIKINVIDD